MSDRPDKTFDGRIERRTILKSTGAAAFAGVTAGAGTASARLAAPADHVGATTVLDVSVEHADVPDMSTNRRTPLSFSTVHRSTGQFVRGLATDDHARTLRENEAVAVADGYRGLPATLFEDRTTTELVVETNSRLQTVETLPLRRRYTTPSVTVEPADGAAVTVAADGRTATVAPQSTGRLALDEREIAYTRPGHLTGDGAARAETATVTPVVNVQNHGRLDAYVWKRGGDHR
jgi:hypothetical protein